MPFTRIKVKRTLLRSSPYLRMGNIFFLFFKCPFCPFLNLTKRNSKRDHWVKNVKLSKVKCIVLYSNQLLIYPLKPVPAKPVLSLVLFAITVPGLIV